MKIFWKILLGVLLLGGIILTAYLLIQHQHLKNLISSDAKHFKEKMTIAGDNWLGYMIFRSPEFQQQIAKEGIHYKFVDDGGKYKERMRLFARGDYDFIVSTIDTYLYNAYDHDFPGVIISIIDESTGGDAIVAKKSIAKINDLDQANIRIAYTKDSPSELLINATIAHFGLSKLQNSNSWKVPCTESKEALKKLREDKADVIVVWEPQVTEATADKRFHKLLGSEKTKGLIIDVLIASRKIITEKPNLVQTVLNNYFKVLHSYTSNPTLFENQAAKDTSTSQPVARTMLKGINFTRITSNLEWFGHSGDTTRQSQIITSIESIAGILKSVGRTDKDLTKGFPYKLINSDLLKHLSNPEVGGFFEQKQGQIVFKNLAEKEWEQLKMVGRLKVEPIYFAASSDQLTSEGETQVQKIVGILKHYPLYRISIQGHTAPSGSEEANKQLSLARANAVLNYMVTLGESSNRIQAKGIGAHQPFERFSGEDDRAYNARLKRVEFWLLEDF